MGGRGERGEEAGGERDGRWSCGGGSGGGLFLSSTFLRASAAWSSSRLRKIDSHGADHFRGVAQMVLAAIFAQQKNQQGGLTSGAIWHIIMASCFSACSSADSPACPHALASLRRSGTCGSSSPLVLMFPTSAPGHHGSPFSASTLSAMRFKLSRSLRSCRIRRSAFAVRYST